MKITSNHLTEINGQLRLTREKRDANHFAALSGQPFVIYGMDEPQRVYLAIATLIEAADAGAAASTLDSKQVENQFGTDKTVSPRVSNYFIDFNVRGNVVQQIAGFVLQRAPDVRGEGKREAARVGFHQRFVASSLALERASPEQMKKGVAKDNERLRTKDSLEGMEGSLKNFAVRRACKFLLYDSIASGQQVIYTLDDMNLGKVVRKEGIHLEGDKNRSGKGKVPVCTSEIREIFRNWDFLQRHVTFYKDFRRVSPPWEMLQDMKGWSNYAAARARKLKGAHDTTQLYKEVKVHMEKAAANQFGPKTIINAFHAAKPSLFNPRYAAPIDNPVHGDD